MRKKTIREVDVRGKRVLIRGDFNVPLDKRTGEVADDTRLRASIPTIRYLLEQDARIILCSHLGRPDGKVVEKLRLDPVARLLSQLLGKTVRKVNDCVGLPVEEVVASLKEGEILLLENLRFHPQEEGNDASFARSLASLADLYVNDAFGTAHRAHASTDGVARYLPAVAGLLMEKELAALSQALVSPQRPFCTIIGGAKVSTKMRVLENLLDKVDVLLIGGGMASTFLKAQGYPVGDSLVENDRLDFARDLIRRAGEKGVKLGLPPDVVVATRIEAGAPHQTLAVNDVPPGGQIVDIGTQTIQHFCGKLNGCKTVLWNGPMGIFEIPPFDRGTRALAEFLAGLEATTLVGGGESVAAIEQWGLADRFTHVSTGGGATLEFLEGRTLPGVAALLDR
ncbi:MAG: phosphoglycerate kinase [Chloroflexi bacterium]|nr:phosphoglycerate kinase [Chloroflexota bacterium]